MENWVKNSTTSARLQEIMSLRNMKQADLARKTGVSRGAISNYVLGRYEPKSDIINKFAIALDCSEMWLWGYDVPMCREPHGELTVEVVDVSARERAIMNKFKNAPESTQEMLLQMIESALNTLK